MNMCSVCLFCCSPSCKCNISEDTLCTKLNDACLCTCKCVWVCVCVCVSVCVLKGVLVYACHKHTPTPHTHTDTNAKREFRPRGDRHTHPHILYPDTHRHTHLNGHPGQDSLYT